MIDAFWSAVEQILPTPFDSTEQPGNWVLFKSTGVNVMHRVLADCVTIVPKLRLFHSVALSE